MLQYFDIHLVKYSTSATPAVTTSTNGLVVSSTSQTGVTTTFAYDAFQREVSQTDGRGNTTRTVYDNFGRVTSTVDALGYATTYGYDALGRQTSVTDPLTNTVYTAYDSEGRVVAQRGATYPVDYSYDEFGEKVSMTTYRNVNGGTGNGEQGTGNGAVQGDVTRWLRDEATGLVTNKVYADGKGPRYDYTPDGKLAARIWARGIVTTYSYDANGALTNTVYSDGMPTLELAWNSQYQLVSVATNGVFAEGYEYDALGRRVSTTTIEGTTRHVYDEGWQVIADLDANGNVVASYVWGDGIDSLLVVKVGGASYYPLADIQGTVWGYVDSQNNVVARWRYDAWGNIIDERVMVPELASLRYRFQGREWSAATGLVNFRMRWYDPGTGRWLSKDPIGLGGGLNLYSFCFNMTLDRIDPFGCDDYQPDNAKHGGPHVDRYHGGKNVGRYNKDGTGIKSKGKLPPKIPRSEWPKFQSAASKLRCGLGLISWIPGILEDIKMHKKAKENGRSFSEQVEEEYKDYEFLITPIGIIPNPYYRPPNMDEEGRLTI